MHEYMELTLNCYKQFAVNIYLKQLKKMFPIISKLGTQSEDFNIYYTIRNSLIALL